MAAQTGRTVQDFVALKISNGGAMVNIPIDTLGDVGLNYPETEMAAFTDAIRGVLVGKPDFSVEFSGPFDNTASTGSHVVLSALVGVMTALSFDVQMGIRHAWEAGEPQFGISAASATNSGAMITAYKVTGGKFTAKLAMIAGSATAPAWGTAAESVPA